MFLDRPKRVSFGLILALSCAALLQAAFLRNVPVRVEQPDGAILNCLASGDEFYNWLHDANGYTILRNPSTGFLVYAAKVDGKLVPTEFVAGRTDPLILDQAGIQIRLLDDQTPQERRMALAADEPIVNVPQTGTINNLVVYIRFSDQADFTGAYVDDTETSFNSTSSGVNSFRNYFSEASYNQLTISSTFYPGTTPDVFSYQDSHPRAYYMPYDATTNPGGYNGETERRTREHTLLQSAVNAIKAEVPAGLTIDADADNYVDNICFIVKGEPTAWSTLLWPHKWALYSYSVYINTKRVYTYNFQLESTLDVGVLCHEMFHSLGAPDLYHYSNYTYLHPVWAWDLMEYQTDPPQHMGAYMKFKYGKWISAIPQITTSGTYSISPLTSTTNNCYKIPSPFSPTEYFVVEYRKKEGPFEGSLYGQGLLVYRINPSYAGNADGPPDEVYIYRPNGTTTVEGSPVSAVFSSNAGRTAINDTTNPSSFLTSGGAGGLSIYGVGATNSTISFSVTLETLTVTSPNGGEFWNAGDNATVTWTNSGTISTVDILLSTDGGTNWMTLVDNTANDGTESITVPAISSSNCLIRVAEGTSGTVFDNSNAAFSIIYVVDSITVTSPNGGESWAIGSLHSITWSTTGTIENVAIEYSIDGGQSWLIAYASVANTGSWSWTVPASPSDSCLVRIADTSNPTVSDTSNTLFSIATQSVVRVDFNKDGQEDILWRYYGSGGYNRVWFLGDSAAPASLSSMTSNRDRASDPKLRFPDHPERWRTSKGKEMTKTKASPDVMSPLKERRRGAGMVDDPRKAGGGKLPLSPMSIDDPRQARSDLAAAAKSDTSIEPASTPILLGGADVLPVGDPTWQIVGTGDFNSDTNVDILWRNSSSGSNVVWFMNGTNWSSSAELIPVSDMSWQIVGTGDFNKDTHVDILWRNSATGSNVVWYMNGTTWIGSAVLLGVSDQTWQIVGTGDFNKDGNADLLWRYNGAGGYNVVWYMNNAAWIGSGELIPVGDQSWQIMGTGDYNKDGSIDILWRYNGAGGYVYIWYMNGVTWNGGGEVLPVGDLTWKIVSR